MKDLNKNPRTDHEATWPDVVLHTVPGAGILVRRPGALLFVPDPTGQTEKLVTGFETAVAATELEGLAEAVLEADFDVPPFAAVVFDSAVTLRVFGDIRLETDQTSTPMLSAAGSDTWVDHTLHRPSDSLSIEVTGQGCDPLTDAQLGSFSAGGFRLLLSGRVETRTAVQPDGVGFDSDLATGLDIGAPRSSDLVNLVLDGMVPADAASNEASGLASDPAVAEERTLEPPTHVSASRSDGSEQEHSVKEHAAHTFLRFDDGQTVEVRQSLVIGRNPIRMAESAKIEPLVIAGEKVSRAHLMVMIEDGKLLVDDCGSRNGSAVLAGERAEPMQLLSGTPVVVGPGAKVYLGSRSFTVLETNLEAA